MRGRHEVTVTVDDEKIAGSPYPVFVKIHPTQLGKPVKVIRGEIRSPHDIAMTIAGDLIVAAEEEVVILSTKTGERRNHRHASSMGVCKLEFVCADVENGCYFVTTSSPEIIKLSSTLEVLGQVSKERSWFLGITIAGNEVLVCDANRSCVVVYNKELVHVRNVGRNLKYVQLWAIFFNKHDSNVYVSGSWKIVVMTLYGELIRSFGGSDRLTCYPYMCVVGSYVYISGLDHQNVAVFTTDGNHVTTFGVKGDNYSHHVNLYGMCTDEDGFLYVYDYEHDGIFVM